MNAAVKMMPMLHALLRLTRPAHVKLCMCVYVCVYVYVYINNCTYAACPFTVGTSHACTIAYECVCVCP